MNDSLVDLSNVEPETEFAGFWRRVCAYLVDGLVITALTMIIATPAWLINSEKFTLPLGLATSETILAQDITISDSTTVKFQVVEITYYDFTGPYAKCRFNIEQSIINTNGSEQTIETWEPIGLCDVEKVVFAEDFIYLFLLLFYAPFLESSVYRASPGKILLGIQVNHTSGERLSLGRSFLRNLSEILCILTFGIGYLVSIFTKRNQALHDLITSTVVVRKDSNVAVMPTSHRWALFVIAVGTIATLVLMFSTLLQMFIDPSIRLSVLFLLFLIFSHIAYRGIISSKTSRFATFNVVMWGMGLVAFSFVFYLSIIFLPAYQDYLLKTAVVEIDREIREKVTAYVARTNKLPVNTLELEIVLDSVTLQNIVRSWSVDDAGQITVTFETEIDNETIVYEPIKGNNVIERWKCMGGTLHSKYRPEGCR